MRIFQKAAKLVLLLAGAVFLWPRNYVCVDGPTFGGCDYIRTWTGIVSPEQYTATAVVYAAYVAWCLFTVIKDRRNSK